MQRLVQLVQLLVLTNSLNHDLKYLNTRLILMSAIMNAPYTSSRSEVLYIKKVFSKISQSSQEKPVSKSLF